MLLITGEVEVAHLVAVAVLQLGDLKLVQRSLLVVLRFQRRRGAREQVLLEMHDLSEVYLADLDQWTVSDAKKQNEGDLRC